MKKKKMRIAAVADIHIGVDSKGLFNEYFAEISNNADVLLLAGDLTKRGLAEEAEILATELLSCKIPVLAVLGNHDYESKMDEDIRRILKQNKVTVLDGESISINGVGFAGAKGFGGGFDDKMLTYFGENMMKRFVQEAVDEALHLEGALNQLSTDKKVILLHYSPIRATIIGEPEEIYPFLGSSRLSDVIDRLGATVAFHGHAHHGTHAGKTSSGIPVFNVAYPMMKEIDPKHSYKLFEI